MVWTGKEEIGFDTGRKARVPGGVIGINAAGSVVYCGSEQTINKNTPMQELTATDGTPLTAVELRELAENQVRMWRRVASDAKGE